MFIFSVDKKKVLLSDETITISHLYGKISIPLKTIEFKGISSTFRNSINLWKRRRAFLNERTNLFTRDFAALTKHLSPIALILPRRKITHAQSVPEY